MSGWIAADSLDADSAGLRTSRTRTSQNIGTSVA